MRNFIVFIYLLCGIMFSQGPVQTHDVDATTDYTWTDVEDIIDRTKVPKNTNPQRTFEPNFQEKYNAPIFDYTKSKPRESLWHKITRFIQELLDYLFDFDDIDQANNYINLGLNIISILIFGFVLYWLIKYFIGKDIGIFSKKNKSLQPEVKTIKENIHIINFKEIIAKHERNEQYRYAVRYQYLHLLKIFTDKGLISWDPDKTNIDYINELKNSNLQTPFKNLTKIFNYVWYGEFDIPFSEYKFIKASFMDIKKMAK